MDQSIFTPLHTPACEVACSSCNLREICLPVGLTPAELAYIDQRLVATRRKVPRGQTLFRTGDPFDALYAVWTGFFKTCALTGDGRSQVTGFQMAGELIGLDGIGTRRHEVDAVALEASQVCVIPFDELESLSQQVTSLQGQFHRIMSREIVRKQGVMLLLGSSQADKRLAAFLLNLAYRLRARGFSSSAVVLRPTREEIGSFLGMSLETVSRTFSRLQAEGLLLVQHRQIQLVDPEGLQRLVDGGAD